MVAHLGGLNRFTLYRANGHVYRREDVYRRDADTEVFTESAPWDRGVAGAFFIRGSDYICRLCQQATRDSDCGDVGEQPAVAAGEDRFQAEDGRHQSGTVVEAYEVTGGFHQETRRIVDLVFNTSRRIIVFRC